MASRERPSDQLRPIEIQRGFTAAPAGSVLWKQGGTLILATASISPKVPDWFGPVKPGGWITADYVMLPGSTPQRKDWPRTGHTDPRGTEITRLVGRALRTAVDLEKLGPHTLSVDCTVLQADGGTRTAAICAGYLAIEQALSKLPPELKVPERPTPAFAANQAAYDPKGALVQQVAAVSVGIIDGEVRLDLDYADDSQAQVDLNVAMTSRGQYVEIQGTAEEPAGEGADAGPPAAGFTPGQLRQMLDLAELGCRKLLEIQRRK